MKNIKLEIPDREYREKIVLCLGMSGYKVYSTTERHEHMVDYNNYIILEVSDDEVNNQ